MYNFRVLGNYLFCDMEPVGDELNPVAEGLRKNVEIRLVNHTANPQVSINGLNNWSPLLYVPLSNITVEGVSMNLADFLTWSTTNTGNFNGPNGVSGATSAANLTVTPTVNSLNNAQAVLESHETRIDTLEGSSTGTTNRIPKFTSSNSLGDSGLIQVGSNIGMGSALVPGELFHIGDGNILLEGGGEVAQKFKRDFSTTGENLGVPTGSGVSVNPIFQVGRIIQAGDGDPEIRIMYSDDNTSERTVFEVDRKGIAASVKTSIGSHFEGFASLTDVNPKFRLNSYPRMRLEMGAGGNDITDVAVERGATGGLDFFTNSTYRGGFDASGNLNLLNAPTAPTATVGTNTTQIATTAFVLANAGGATLASELTVTPAVNGLLNAQAVLTDHETRIDTLESSSGITTTPLTYGRVSASSNLASKSFVSTGVGTTVDFTATVYSSGTTFSGTNGIIPSATGRYRASYYLNVGSDETSYNGTILVVQGGVSLGSVYINQHNSTGSVNQSAGFIDVDVASGTAVFLHYQPDTSSELVAFDKGSYFQLSQLPTAVSTVLDGTIPVNDQGSYGYYDIGTIRTMWGLHDDGNVDTTTVSLPAAFLNNTYTVVATSNNGIAGSTSIEAKTTTSFDIDRASTTTSTNIWGWIAIGQKP